MEDLSIALYVGVARRLLKMSTELVLSEKMVNVFGGVGKFDAQWRAEHTASASKKKMPSEGVLSGSPE